MAKVKNTTREVPKKSRPALSPEARENQMIALAVDLAEQQLRDGTASSQVITHFLKLGTEKAKLENKLLEAQTEMAVAKKDQLQSQQRTEELYAEAIKAMRRYNGQGSEEEDDEY